MKNKLNSLFKPLLVFIILAGLSIGVWSCKKEDKTEKPGPNEVFMQNTAFNPSILTVTKGTTVTWINKDDMQHTASDNGSAFDSGAMNKDQTYPFTFSTAGTFSYFCGFHSGMNGTIIVQ